MLAIIAAGANFAPGSSEVLSSIHPGPLSSVHDRLTREQGCGACHVAHDEQGIAWFTAAILPQDNSGRCLQCHAFAQPERGAHNTQFTHRDDLTDIECDACHTEHQGADYAPATVANAVCTACHQLEFDSFSAGHPAFQNKFPYQIPNSVNFNHTAHLGEYFTDDRWTGQANRDADFAARASNSCITCHQVEAATHEVKPRPYEEVCANCHDSQITSRALVLISPDEIFPVAALLFELDEDAHDPEADLITAIGNLSADNLDFLAARVDELDKIELVQRLFAGLSSEAVDSATQAWLDEQEYEPAVLPELELSGWHAGEDAEGGQSIHYRPSGHRDPLVRAWIEMALTLANDEDVDIEFSAYALEHLLDDAEGPGACGKCHAAGLASSARGDGQPAQWKFRGSTERPYTPYAHSPHLKLLGPESACQTCHQLDEAADYETYFGNEDRQSTDFVSNFHPIQKETCDQCHQPGIVKSDCQLCHQYHQDASFKVKLKGRTAVSDQ